MNPMLLDFLPLLAFYAAFYVGGIYAATTTGMVASAASIAWMLARRQPVRPMAWVSFALIVVFGGATLWLHDESFIKWKPTILYWIFAVVLALAPRLAGRNPIRALLGKELALPDALWSKVNDSWAMFFAVLGATNLYIANHFSTAVWAAFKVFGTLGLMLLFVVVQGVVLSRHLPASGKDEPGQ